MKHRLISILFVQFLATSFLPTHWRLNDDIFLNMPFESTVVEDDADDSIDDLPLSISPTISFNGNTETYFSNLYDYSPINSNGSCGYVSLIQYMSYYDTFYNDGIIPERYERRYENATTASQALSKSPGVLRQSYPTDSVQLAAYVIQNKDVDFQAKCMSIKNAGMLSYSPSIGMWDYESIFDGLYGVGQASFDYVTYSSYSNSPTDPSSISGLDLYVKNLLDEGKPVILHIATDGSYTSYHSVVAYYYDDYGIHCNFGWGSSSTDMTLDGYYIYMAGTADFTLMGEIHSDNYRVGSQYYCGCGEHYHNYTYTCVDSLYHRCRCVCGYSYLERHVFESLGMDSNGTCRRCNYES